MTFKKLAIILPPLIAISILILWVFHSKTHNPNTQNYIQASGTIEGTETTIASKVPGKIKNIFANEGDRVIAGQLIAQIEDTELQAQANQAQAALKATQAQLDQAIAGAQPQEIQQAQANLAQAKAAVEGAAKNLKVVKQMYQESLELKAQADAAQAQVEKATAAYDQAKSRLELLLAGATQEQLQQAQAAVNQAQATFNMAKNDAQRAQQLLQNGAISKQQYEATQTHYQLTQAQLEQAQARLAEIQKGARTQEIEQAQANLQQAKANLDGAKTAFQNANQIYQKNLTLKQHLEAAQAQLNIAKAQEKAAHAQLDLLLAGTRTETIHRLQAQLEQAQANLQFAQAQLNHTRIRASTNGIVSNKNAQPGEIVAIGTPIITIIDPQHLWLRVYIPEKDYGKIKISQPAEITVDSFPNQTFPGKVIEIAQQAEFTPKNIQTKELRLNIVFGIKIEITHTKGKLKPGMPADAKIITE